MAGDESRQPERPKREPRVILTRFNEVLEYVGESFGRRDSAVLVFDGMCCAGKSLIAQSFAPMLKARVVHMDDFYLPRNKHTKARMAEPGGHIDYERFADQVIPYLDPRTYINYDRYDCHAKTFTPVSLVPRRVTIVEGTYSMHPFFEEAYRQKNVITVFWYCDKKTQTERLLAREGEEGVKAFREKWLPRERKYFRECQPRERAMIALSTDEAIKF